MVPNATCAAIPYREAIINMLNDFLLAPHSVSNESWKQSKTVRRAEADLAPHTHIPPSCTGAGHPRSVGGQLEAAVRGGHGGRYWFAGDAGVQPRTTRAGHSQEVWPVARAVRQSDGGERRAVGVRARPPRRQPPRALHAVRAEPNTASGRCCMKMLARLSLKDMLGLVFSPRVWAKCSKPGTAHA
jgi:hypothetical protein